jgi:hypothetical protein
VVKVLTNGKGSGLFMESTNTTNINAMMHIKHYGTGQFLRLESSLGDVKTTIANNGDIVTDGIVKVRENKGIVRSSTNAQQRIEHFIVNIPAHTYGECCPQFVYVEHIDVDFETPFSSPPIVLTGDLVSGHIGGLTLTVEDVTETGFTVIIQNLSLLPWTIPSGTEMKFIAIGTE